VTLLCRRPLVLAALWVLGLAPAVAQVAPRSATTAVPVVAVAAGADWVYRVVGGDTLTAIARNYLQPRHGWQALQKHNRRRNADLVLPGEAVLIPVAWLRRELSLAEVVYVRGDASVQAGNSAPPNPAHVGDRLSPGALLATGVQSALALRLIDGTRLLLNPQTRVLLDQLLSFGRSGFTQANITLFDGTIDADVPPRATPAVLPLEIRTPTASLGVRGTSLRAGADAASLGSRVEVLAGVVGAAAGAGAGAGTAAGAGARTGVTVNAGFGTTAAADGRIAPPRALLAAPLLAAASGRYSGWPVQAQWPALAGAAGYRAQLFADAQTRQLLQEQRVTDAQAQYATLADGRYWLRVRGIAADGLEGLDAVVPLEMQRVVELPPAAPVPRLAAPLPAASPAEDDTVTAEAVVFAWTAVDTTRAYRLQVAASADFVQPVVDLVVNNNAGFNLVQARVELPAGAWYWRVAGVAEDGSVGAFSPGRPFTSRRRAP
jgi:hypothetical protein